jgi:hypothetical protein
MFPQLHEHKHLTPESLVGSMTACRRLLEARGRNSDRTFGKVSEVPPRRWGIVGKLDDFAYSPVNEHTGGFSTATWFGCSLRRPFIGPASLAPTSRA